MFPVAPAQEHLALEFLHAVVDGIKGDTYLSRVESHFGRTVVISQGNVKGHPVGCAF